MFECFFFCSLEDMPSSYLPIFFGLSSSDQIQFYCHTSTQLQITPISRSPALELIWYIHAEPDNDNLSFFCFWRVDLATLSPSHKKGTHSFFLEFHDDGFLYAPSSYFFLGSYVLWTICLLDAASRLPTLSCIQVVDNHNSYTLLVETWVTRYPCGSPTVTQVSLIKSNTCTVNVDCVKFEYVVLAKYHHMLIFEIDLLTKQHILILCKKLLLLYV